MSTRVTRNRSRNPEEQATGVATFDSPMTVHTAFFQLKQSQAKIKHLSAVDLKKELRTLSKEDRDLIRLKQRGLRGSTAQVPAFVLECNASSNEASSFLAQAGEATCVFAGDTAGTAITISPTGLLLTCSHCIAESPADLDLRAFHRLLTSSGHLVRALCVAWDPKRDLALLQITTAFLDIKPFPYVCLSWHAPRTNSKLVCFGHPGAEDFETHVPGVPTGYDILHVSHGHFRGYATGQDIQDNSEIGALMHDCWTYWGHSGAPLVEVRTGGLVGLHSSWDDETGMRRGVAWSAIREFLAEHCTQCT